jgi:LuxR family maltose regulon positive regulatory protein
MRDLQRSRAVIERPRLTERIHDAMKAPVAIITAPAGFGKTIALNEVRQNTGGTHVRLDLNANSDTFFRFAYEFCRALAPLSPALSGSLPDAYSIAMRTDKPEGTLAAWLHEQLQGISATIFIDQMHYIGDVARVAQFLTAAVDRHTAGIRWVFVTREDAGLPLARWTQKGIMKAPVDTAALRFEFHDVARAAARVRVERTHKELKTIYEGTKAWPMGVAFALRNDARVWGAESSPRIAGDLYAKRTHEEQEFLLSTCLFSTADVALCKAAGWLEAPKILRAMQDDVPFMFITSEHEMLQFHDAFASHVQAILKCTYGRVETAIKNAASAFEKLGDLRSLLLLYARFGSPKQIAHALASSSAQLLEQGHRELVVETLSLLDPNESALSSVILAIKAILASND